MCSRADVRRDIRPEHSPGTGWVSNSIPGRDQPLSDDLYRPDDNRYRRWMGRDRRQPIKSRKPWSEPHQRAGQFHYSQVRNALINDAKSTADFQATRLADQYALGLRAGDALHLAVCAGQGAVLSTLDRRLDEAAAALGVKTALL